MPIDFCDLVQHLRGVFFARDRDVTLQTGRVFDGARLIPVGGIILWSGAVGDIPTSWQLCDGTNGTPDLQDRFIVGAGSSYNVGDTGGAATNNLYHRHAISDTSTGPSATQPVNTIGGTTRQGDTATHTHTTSGNTNYQLSATTENRPPFYALAFIQRMS